MNRNSKNILENSNNAQIRSRIEEIKAKKGLPVSELEAKAGLENGNISKWKDKHLEKPSKGIEKFLTFWDVNRKWWETGKGEIFEEKRTPVREVSVKNEATPIDQDVVQVRVVEIKAQAGYLRGYADPEYMESLHTHPVSKDAVQGGNFLCFTVNGDSMDDGSKKSLGHGDIVLGRELARHHWSNKLHYKRNVFIIIHGSEGICFKEITAHNVETGEITCHSWNDHYEDFTLNLKDVKQLFYIKQLVQRNLTF